MEYKYSFLYDFFDIIGSALPVIISFIILIVVVILMITLMLNVCYIWSSFFRGIIDICFIKNFILPSIVRHIESGSLIEGGNGERMKMTIWLVIAEAVFSLAFVMLIRLMKTLL